MPRRKLISGKKIEAYMKMLLGEGININNSFVVPRSIFKVKLPSTEKLTLFALAWYYYGPVSRIPTCEQLAEEIDCSPERMEEALLTIASYFEGEQCLVEKHLH